MHALWSYGQVCAWLIQTFTTKIYSVLRLIVRSITCSPAGLSRVNGVRHSSAETWNFNPSPKAQFYIKKFQIWHGWLRYGGHQPWQSWFESDERSMCHVGSTYTGAVTFCFFVFIFFNRATAHTSELIFAHNGSKDAVWSKEDPFGMRNV